MEKSKIRSKLLTGILIITLGVLYLLHIQGVKIPFKIFSWPVILICIGIVILVKHDFKKLAGYILVGIGGVYLLDDLPNFSIDTRLVFPIIVILIGMNIMYKALTRNNSRKDSTIIFDDDKEMTSEQYFESNVIFGGAEKSIVTNDFQGAKIGSYFGGTELNMMKSDIKEKAVIEMNTWFGGTSIIVPNDWQVKNDVMTLFGGVEDKRSVELITDSNKVLILKGNCIFGGVEIQNYS